MLVLLVMGFCGSITFQHHTQGNILLNLSGIPAQLARICLTITMFFTFPLEMFVCRNAIHEFIKIAFYRFLDFGKYISDVNFQRILVLILITMITTLSILVTKLGIVLEFTGGIAGIPIAFILPPLFYLRLSKRKFLSFQKFAALFLLIVGTFCLIASTSFNIYSVIVNGI